MEGRRGNRRAFHRVPASASALMLAFLLILAGCGGAGLMDTSSLDTTSNEYAQVNMLIKADYDVEYAMEVVDADVSKTDLADLRCEIVFDPTGTGATPNGVSILQAAQTYPDDCPDPPGPGKCIKCINEYKFMDGGEWKTDPTQSHCVGTCVGIVPEVWLNNDTIPIQIVFYSDVDTSITQAGLAMIRTDGSATNSDFIEADLANIHLFSSDDYIYTGCDGNPDPPEMTMTLDEPLQGQFDNYSDPGTGTISWTKAFTITDMGQPDPGSGFNSCSFETHLDGDLILSTDPQMGSIEYSVKFCSDMQSCTAFGAGGSLNTQSMTFFDGLNATLDGNGEAMLTPELGMNFETSMVSASINTDTVVIESTDLGYGLSQPELTLLAASYDRNDGITADDFVAQITDAYQYQLHDFVQMIWDVVSQSNETLDTPIFLEFTSGCAISDTFAKNSQGCYRADTSITGQPFTPTLSDWQAINAVTALSFNTTTASVLKYVDLYKTVGQVQSLRIDKLVDVPGAWQVEAVMSGVAGFDDESGSGGGTSDFIRFGVLNSSYSGYVIGVEGIFDGKSTLPSCFVVRYLNGSVQEGAYINCDKQSNITMELSYEPTYSGVFALVSTDGGQSWTDLEAQGAVYPGASSRTLTYVTMSGDHNAVIEAMSTDHATANDNYVNIDLIRWLGLDNSGNALIDQFSDDDYVEQGGPPS